MLRRGLPFILLIALVLAACQKPTAPTPTPQEDTSSSAEAPSTTEKKTVESIRLPMGYIPNVQYAPFYLAHQRGYFRDAGFEVEFDYSFETDGIALVGAGEIPFAVVSGEQVLLARAQGLPVVYVMTWWQKFPVAVVADAKLGLESPADLKGQTIALPGLFGANYIGLMALLYQFDLQETDVTLESIGFNQVRHPGLQRHRHQRDVPAGTSRPGTGLRQRPAHGAARRHRPPGQRL